MGCSGRSAPRLGGGSYGYSTAGLLDTRHGGQSRHDCHLPRWHGQAADHQHDGQHASRSLSETLSWTGDGLLGTHVLAREDFTDERDYTYAALSRRLVEERVNLDAANRWTNDFVYDGGASGGWAC